MRWAIATLAGVLAVIVFQCRASSAFGQGPSPAAQIEKNIEDMLQRKAPIKVLPDIPNGAPNATTTDAAFYAWQEFVALNWANLPVTGTASTSSDPGAREVADTSLQFGQPPLGSSVCYPALVWETTRHRAEVFTTGSGNPPHGYKNAANQSWGYNSTPGYVYQTDITINPPQTPSNCTTINPAFTPFVNLDEGSQIGVCRMFSGVPYSSAGPKNLVLFMAKASFQEYGYIASRGWYNTALVETPRPPAGSVASNTSGYLVTQGQLPPAGALDGSQNPGSYISFPTGTLEFKAAFRVATDAERQAHEKGQPIPGGYHVAPIRYYDGASSPYTYVDTCGALLSLHIIHKTPTAPYFIFATFEHKDNVIGTDGKPVEDADGSLNANAFTPTPPTPPNPPYVYPSAGTAPSGKYLVDATTPNVVEAPANSGTAVQQFVPAPSDNAGPMSTTQSSYQNTRDGATSTLPSANSPSAGDSYLSVNRRRFSIPSSIIDVNKSVHNLIAQNGYNKSGNTWLNYKLVNVQWVPAGNKLQKTPGELYGDTANGAKPSIPVESFYLSNSLVETNLVLSAFSGQFGPYGPSVGNKYDGISITDFYFAQTQYTDTNTGKSITKNPGDPFYNIYTTGGPYNMGGCMGCHGNAAVGGFDSSFILRGAPFSIEGFQPSADPIFLLKRQRSFFR